MEHKIELKQGKWTSEIECNSELLREQQHWKDKNQEIPLEYSDDEIRHKTISRINKILTDCMIIRVNNRKRVFPVILISCHSFSRLKIKELITFSRYSHGGLDSGQRWEEKIEIRTLLLNKK